MTLQVERLDTLLKNADPLISETLNRALSDKEMVCRITWNSKPSQKENNCPN